MKCSVVNETKYATDISVVLTIHREGNLLIRTLLSLRDAAAFAKTIGLAVELVCVFDRSDEHTYDAFQRSPLHIFDSLETLSTDYGSPALARAAGCAIAHGKYINLCDGDDLISFNALRVMYTEAERLGDRVVLFHEWLFAFGESYHFTKYVGLNRISPLAFINANPYTSKAFFNRRILDDVSFQHVGIDGSYAYEDWHFVCELIAHGFEIHVASGTIVFYRQRHGVFWRSNRDSVRAIPPSRLFEPNVYRELCHSSDNFHLKDAWADLCFVESHACKLLTHAANKIEPQIEHRLISDSGSWTPTTPHDIKVGQVYLDVCRQIDASDYAHVFFLPWVTKGGADRYMINLINVLGAMKPDERILVLLGEAGMPNTWLDRITVPCTIIDLSLTIKNIGDDGIDLIALKLVQSCAGDAIFHLRTSLFAFRFFKKYGRALRDNKSIVYQFGNDVYIDQEFVVIASWSPSFVTEHEINIDAFVTDSAACAHQSQINTLGDKKWHILPTLCNAVVTHEDLRRRTEQVSHRVLWASRLAPQKRCALIKLIAERLSKRLPNICIDVWGALDPGYDPSDSFGHLANVSYKGPYEHFEEIATPDYFCFLYTSLFDGVPTVLLEAASSGLPIIAPDVGGVGLFVIDGETGVLLPSVAADDQMADAYVSALGELYRRGGERYKLAAKAFDKLRAEHSTAAYARAVEIVMESLNEGRAA